MLKKLFGVLAVLSQFIAPAFASYNDRLLDSASDSLTTKILSGVSVSSRMIQEKVECFHREEGAAASLPSRFSSVYAEITSKIDAPCFQTFSQSCYDLYNGSDARPEMQTAVHLLFQKVSEKYLKAKKLLDKHQKLKKDEAATRAAAAVYSDADKIFDLLLAR